jgi:antibiotic biosynthesis monooxygenase (ABM) superfamily enzyme
VSDPVTAIVRSLVLPENFDRYRAATRELSAACSEFPGYGGTRVIEPSNVESEWVTIFSFNSYQNYDRWINSPERGRCLSVLNRLTEGEVSREQISGLDYWTGPAAKKSGSWPPSWRMTGVAFLAIFPLSYFVPNLVRGLFPHQPMLGSVLAIVAVTVLMSYISLPLMVRIFRRWL